MHKSSHTSSICAQASQVKEIARLSRRQ
jgi:hypothetical protein